MCPSAFCVQRASVSFWRFLFSDQSCGILPSFISLFLLWCSLLWSSYNAGINYLALLAEKPFSRRKSSNWPNSFLMSLASVSCSLNSQTFGIGTVSPRQAKKSHKRESVSHLKFNLIVRRYKATAISLSEMMMASKGFLPAWISVLCPEWFQEASGQFPMLFG